MSKETQHTTGSDRQRQHYEEIHEEYMSHYYDKYSMEYRRKMILKPLFDDLDFSNKTVADLACGNGPTSKELLKKYPDLDILGFDISEQACGEYKKEVGSPCHELDLTSDGSPENCCDVAIIVGGLHHCVCDLPKTLQNISKMIRPGGCLLMVEPNANFFLESFRKRWYKTDYYFDDETEEALSHDKILKIGSPWFRSVNVQYLGGPGYFLILNSLLFRLPKWIKRPLTKPLIFVDRIVNKLPGKCLFPFFIARWERLENKQVEAQ